RLRWEIEPALAEGRHVVAAPYIDTAVAFGRACGLPAKWLSGLFRFARKPSVRRVIRTPPGAARPMAGFVEFGCSQLGQRGRPDVRLKHALASHTGRYLGARRGSGQRSGVRAR